MSQPKSHSMAEALINTVVGYCINLGVQLLIYPLYGATFTFHQNIEIGLIFMAVSIARSYVFRRAFNAWNARA